MIFEDADEYIKKSREERRSHLSLEDGCIEIGGTSQLFRGLLAHFLGTTIGGRKIYVCHACNNPRCSNPRHLYWGTPTDNVLDQKESGTWKSGYQKMVLKHGKDAADEILRKRASLGGKSGGGHNSLSDEEIKVWRDVISKSSKKRGWISRTGKEMGKSHTQVRRIIQKYFSDQADIVRK